MDRPRLYKTEAIVLKHAPMGEADRLVTLYTPSYGKVRAVAKGARRPKSRLGGHIQPLSHIQVVLARGRNLAIVTQADAVATHRALLDDLWRMTCGVYMAELADQFGQEELENPGLYRLLRDGLAALAEAPDAAVLLRYYEMRLLTLAGYLPELQRCVSCGAALPTGGVFFSAGAGGVLCPPCRARAQLALPLSQDALQALRLFAECALSTALALRMPEQTALEVGHLLRQYMRYILERDLKSAAFLDALRGDMEPARDPAPSPA